MDLSWPSLPFRESMLVQNTCSSTLSRLSETPYIYSKAREIALYYIYSFGCRYKNGKNIRINNGWNSPDPIKTRPFIICIYEHKLPCQTYHWFRNVSYTKCHTEQNLGSKLIKLREFRTWERGKSSSLFFFMMKKFSQERGSSTGLEAEEQHHLPWNTFTAFKPPNVIPESSLYT